MLIQSLEQKTRLALFTVIAAIVGCTVTCGICIFFCTRLVTDERNQIYRALARRRGITARSAS